MRHVNQTRQGLSPYVGERFQSSVGVVEFRTMINRNGEWYPNCRKCTLQSDPCGFVECFLAYQKKGDQNEKWYFGYYAKIEEEEN